MTEHSRNETLPNVQRQVKMGTIWQIILMTITTQSEVSFQHLFSFASSNCDFPSTPVLLGNRLTVKLAELQNSREPMVYQLVLDSETEPHCNMLSVSDSGFHPIVSLTLHNSKKKYIYLHFTTTDMGALDRWETCLKSYYS